VDPFETIFLPGIAELRETFGYNELMILAGDEHSTQVTPRVIALYKARKIISIKLVPHFPHLGQPPDLCASGLFKMIYRKERQGDERRISKDLSGSIGFL
jgi:hypothetical protein